MGCGRGRLGFRVGACLRGYFGSCFGFCLGSGFGGYFGSCFGFRFGFWFEGWSGFGWAGDAGCGGRVGRAGRVGHTRCGEPAGCAQQAWCVGHFGCVGCVECARDAGCADERRFAGPQACFGRPRERAPGGGGCATERRYGRVGAERLGDFRGRGCGSLAKRERAVRAGFRRAVTRGRSRCVGSWGGFRYGVGKDRE